MPIYRKASAEVGQIVEAMIEKYHGELQDAEVNVECLFAYATKDKNGDPVGPAVLLGGYQCAAVVRVLNLKDRTAGRGDCEIVIDGDRWDTWGDDEKAALIDHELEHLELKTDKDGGVIRDDLGRPKLRLRKHDYQFGWFDSIARRHGPASFEVQQYRKHVTTRHQQWLPGFDLETAIAEVNQYATDEEDAPKPITTADGRKIGVAQMMDELDQTFGGKGRGRKAAASR